MTQAVCILSKIQVWVNMKNWHCMAQVCYSMLLHAKCLYYLWVHNQIKSLCFANVEIRTKAHWQSALLLSEDPPHQKECCRTCLLLLLRSLGYAVPRERPCLMTTSSIWHWSMLTSTVVLLSVFMRKRIVKTAISNSGLVPMKALPTGLTNPCQLNWRFKTWSSWSGCGQIKIKTLHIVVGDTIYHRYQHRNNLVCDS